VNPFAFSARVAAAIAALDRSQFLRVVEPSAAEDRPDEDPEVSSLEFRPRVNPDAASEYYPLDNPCDHAFQLGLLAEHLRPGATVLDCGSGSGYLSAALALLVAGSAETGGAVVGVERRSSWATSCVPKIAMALKAAAADSCASSALDLDGSIMHRIMVLPVDGAEPVFFPHAPFSAIRVGFSLSSSDGEEAANLLQQLRRGGRMVAHIAGHSRLRVFDKAENGSVSSFQVETATRFPPDLLQRRVAVDDDAPYADATASRPGQAAQVSQPTPQEVAAAAAAAKERSAAKEQVQKALQDWREEFERQHGRRPTRDDLAADPDARALFAKFSQLNRPDPL